MADAMRYFVLLLLLVNSLPAQEVKHAPTVEQCRADQRLWLDKLEKSPGSPGTLPDYWTLHDWDVEMADCRVVDHDRSLYYDNVSAEISSAQLLRLERFVDRQGLWDKFIEEDKAGKR